MFIENAKTIYSWLKFGYDEGYGAFDLSDVTNAWMYVNWVVDSTYNLSVGDRQVSERIKERTETANEVCLTMLQDMLLVLDDIKVDNSAMKDKLDAVIDLFEFHDLTDISGLVQDIHGESQFAQTFFNVVSDVLLESVSEGKLLKPDFEGIALTDLNSDKGFDKTLVMPSVIAEFLTTVNYEVNGAVKKEATTPFPATYTAPPKPVDEQGEESFYSLHGVYNYFLGNKANEGIKSVADAMQAKMDQPV